MSQSHSPIIKQSMVIYRFYLSLTQKRENILGTIYNSVIIFRRHRLTVGMRMCCGRVKINGLQRRLRSDGWWCYSNGIFLKRLSCIIPITMDSEGPMPGTSATSTSSSAMELGTRKSVLLTMLRYCRRPPAVVWLLMCLCCFLLQNCTFSSPNFYQPDRAVEHMRYLDAFYVHFMYFVTF